MISIIYRTKLSKENKQFIGKTITKTFEKTCHVNQKTIFLIQMTKYQNEIYLNNQNFILERQQDNFYEFLYDFGESQLQNGYQNGDIYENQTHIKCESCNSKDVERKHFKAKIEPTNQFKRDNLKGKFVRD